MRSRRFSALRRVVTSVLLLSFASYGAEAAIADVHHGDQVEQHVSTDHAPSTPNQSQPDGSDVPGDSHPFHVCHCSHTHAGVLPVLPDLTSSITPAQQLHWLGALTLPSIRRAPPLRPPIA